MRVRTVERNLVGEQDEREGPQGSGARQGRGRKVAGHQKPPSLLTAIPVPLRLQFAPTTALPDRLKEGTGQS